MREIKWSGGVVLVLGIVLNPFIFLFLPLSKPGQFSPYNDRRFGVRFPARPRELFPLQHCPDIIYGPSILLSSGYLEGGFLEG
jgi:hypothetical protein